MKIKPLKMLVSIAVLVAIVFTMCSCSLSDILSRGGEKPAAVEVRTDLKDAVFTFTYAQLRKTVSADKVAEIFEDYDKLSDDITVKLSYNDIASRFEEGSDEFNAVMALCTEQELNALKANSDEVLEYYVNGINRAKAEKPIVKYSEGFWTDKDTISFKQNGQDSDSRIKKAAEYFDYFVNKGVSSYFEDKANGKCGTTEKGADLTDIVYLYGESDACRLKPENVESVISSLVYEKQEYGDEQIITGITRVVKITLKDDEESVKKAFSLQDKTVILNELKKGSDYFTVDDYAVSYNGCTIVATFNAVTDNLLSVTYDKKMVINTDVTGTGSLEHIGTQQLSFECTRWVEYHFGWEAEAK